jgi:ethanolamine utilization protein EutA (predicted chaperonin)
MLQDMVAAAGQVRAVGSSPAVVSVANLTSAQVQVAAQRLASANLVSQSQTVVTTVVTKGKHTLLMSLGLQDQIHFVLSLKKMPGIKIIGQNNENYINHLWLHIRILDTYVFL